MQRRKEWIEVVDYKSMNTGKCVYDVIVVGGGTAGWVAALAAARMKKKVLLLERKGYLGGALATCLPILGFHDAQQNQVVRGYAHEFVVRLSEHKGSEGYHLTDLWHSSLVTVNGTIAKHVITEMLYEAGVEIAMFSQVTDVVMHGNRIKGVVVHKKTGTELYLGNNIIDATGDAAVACLAGAKFSNDGDMENLQPPTLLFRMDNVDMGKLREYLINNKKEFVDWRIKPGRAITQEFLRTVQLFFVFPDLIGKIKYTGEYMPIIDRFMFITIPRTKSVVVNMLRSRNVDGTCSQSMSKATVQQYLNLIYLSDFFIENIPGFEEAYLSEAEPEIQIRETRRIVGDYELNLDDVISGRNFEDTIALGGYFVDVHNSSDSHCTCQLINKGFGIPYRALLPKGTEGLLVAGRCISGTKEASGSYRVMATCMAVGQAAGTAAALCAENKLSPREVDVANLQDILRRDGAVLE